LRNSLLIENSAPKPIEIVTGLIERVTFFSEESGFAVLKVKAKGRRDLVTVIGSLPAVTAGEWLTAEGFWVHNKDHGFELRAQKLTSVPPTTREGIEKYLGSGMVKGIGPVYAKKLVASFGEQIFDIIENSSARLEDIPGIGPGRRRKIKEAWAEQKVIRKIMVFLHSNGVSTARAVRIYKTYGENAIEKVQANPYLLARDIPGIGFKTADEIAQKLGIPRDSIMRACAGLEFVLSEAIGNGHCALPRDILLQESQKVLSLDETLIAEALMRLLQKRDLINELIQGEDLVFLPGLRTAEEGIAAEISLLASQPAAYPPIDFEKAIHWAATRTGKVLGDSQKEALRLTLQNRVMIITGGPGVGKTTLLNTLLTILRVKKVQCLLCAPTGRAARRLGESTGMAAQTIHRLLEVQPNRGFTRDATRPLECDLLVVDEMSMVDVPLMNSLLRAHPPNANLLLVGDVDQLPSVGPGSVLSDLIESGVIAVARLTEIYRQAANSHIVTNAHRINRGEPLELQSKEDDSDFYFIERDTPEAILATVKDLVTSRIPKKFGFNPGRDIQFLSPMNRGSLGVRELNLALQTELNPPREGALAVEKFGWQFRVGDKVIQLENNYDKEVFNGDIGEIREIDPIEKELRIDFEGRDIIYDFGELDELALAYAITVHKSQGSEFPVVIIPIATQQYLLLQRNLIYTAITRGKKLVILVGQRKALQMAIRNNQTSRRFGGLLARLRAAASGQGT
jgi:exodeoxyribonuclease V alpha subunit